MITEIQIQNLYKTYPKGAEALKGVSLLIKKGYFFTLLGSNGAGKSTLVKKMTTLVVKDTGTFLINKVNPEKNFSKIQEYIGVASQDNELNLSEKLDGLLVFQGRLFGMSKNESKRRAEELIEIFKLTGERTKKTSDHINFLRQIT